MATAPDEESLLSPAKIHTRLALLAAAHLLGMLLYGVHAAMVRHSLVDWLWNFPWVPEWLLRMLQGDFYNTLAWALYMAPPALLAMTIVLPDWKENDRIMLTIIGVPATALMITVMTGFSPELLQFLVFPGVAFVVAVVICILMRRAGYSIRFVPPAQRTPPPRPLHFDMTQLLVAVAGIALLLGVMRWFKHLDPNGLLAFRLRPTIIPFGLEILRVLPAVMLPVCAGLATTRVLVRSSIVVGCVIAANVPTLYYYEPESAWQYPMQTLLLCYLCFLSAHVVRSCGYRLVRSADESPVSDSSAESVSSEVNHV